MYIPKFGTYISKFAMYISKFAIQIPTLIKKRRMKGIRIHNMAKRMMVIMMSTMIGMPLCAQSIPLVYDVENTGRRYAEPLMLEPNQLPIIQELPDALENVSSFADWAKRRSDIAHMIQHYGIGQKPIVEPHQVKGRMEGDTALVVDVTINGLLAISPGSPPLPSGRSVFRMRGASFSSAVKNGSSDEQPVVAAKPKATNAVARYFDIFLIFIALMYFFVLFLNLFFY